MTRHHQHGRWQARIGRGAENMDLYLGTFGTQEEAAEAYDIAAIKFDAKINMLPVVYPNQSHGQSCYSSDELPSSVVMTFRPGSTVKSMDFHPVQQILLLVGTNMGDVMVYELPSHEKIAIKNFKVWDLGACSTALQIWFLVFCKIKLYKLSMWNWHLWNWHAMTVDVYHT